MIISKRIFVASFLILQSALSATAGEQGITGSSYLTNAGASEAQTFDFEELTLLEAIHATILHNPQLKVGAVQVDVSRESIEVQEGNFDTFVSASGSTSSSENPTPVGVGQVIRIDNRSDALNATISRLTKSSVQFDFTVSSTGTGDESMGITANEAAVSTAALTLTYPLWRGRGEYLTTLRLKIAELEYESASLDLGHQVDLSILGTVRNYWEYRGATETLKLLEDSEESSRFLLQQITKLVEADELTRGELGVIESQVSQRRGSRLAGEQRVVQAQASLANSIGVYLASGAKAHTPTTKLPEPVLDETQLASIPGAAVLPYIDQHRKDFASLQRRIEIANRTLELAADATNPTLNLVLGGQYRTFEQNNDFLKSYGAPSYGPDWSVRLDYNYSLNQTTARANQRIAALGTRQRTIEHEELIRAAEVDFNAAAFSLVQSLHAYREAVERMALSETNVRNERRKFLLDAATLLDVLNVEDQLLQAQLDVISQRVTYSNSLANLMFLSGYLSQISSDALTEIELKRADGLLNELRSAAVQPTR